jgi:putative pyruvate formate lyase activating enzyme
MLLDRYMRVLAGEERPVFHDTRSSGDLGRKIEQANAMMDNCQLCEWRCNADRNSGKTGKCGVSEARVVSEFLHMGEERELVPSHTVFFAGCNFECGFCQNHDISQSPGSGDAISPERLATMIDGRYGPRTDYVPLFPFTMMKGGGRNVNFVGGDPTPNLPYILEVLDRVDTPVPVVWNSNMYLTEGSMALLDGVVDLYLTDFKYGNDDCAKTLSGVDDYTHVVSRNHILAEKNGDLLIRHLVLPGHVECCTKPIMDIIAEKLESARINIMDQFRPVWRAGSLGLTRMLDPNEYNEAVHYAQKVLDKGRFSLQHPL